MANKDNKKIIKIWGVTIANESGRTRPYGHGRIKKEGEFVDYTDYFIDDLIKCIKQQELEKIIVNKLQDKLC